MDTILTTHGAVLSPEADRMWKNKEENVNILNMWIFSDLLGFSVFEIFLYTFCIPLL
jgi:hypothetical protein